MSTRFSLALTAPPDMSGECGASLSNVLNGEATGFSKRLQVVSVQVFKTLR